MNCFRFKTTNLKKQLNIDVNSGKKTRLPTNKFLELFCSNFIMVDKVNIDKINKEYIIDILFQRQMRVRQRRPCDRPKMPDAYLIDYVIEVSIWFWPFHRLIVCQSLDA